MITRKNTTSIQSQSYEVNLLSFEPRTCSILIQYPKQYATVGCDKIPEKFDTYACKEYDNTLITLK